MPKTGPSEHLTWREIACRDRMRTPYPLDWRDDPTRLPKLVAAFEAVRAIYGVPLKVNSAYRTRVYNAQVGGRINSQHLQGRALDLRRPEGHSTREFYDAILQLAIDRPELGIRYVQGYPALQFVHVDVRPATILMAQWSDDAPWVVAGDFA